jgi:hypothetical protein
MPLLVTVHPRQTPRAPLEPRLDDPLTLAHDPSRTGDLVTFGINHPDLWAGAREPILALPSRADHISRLQGTLAWTGRSVRVENLSTTVSMYVREWGAAVPAKLGSRASASSPSAAAFFGPRLVISFAQTGQYFLVISPTGDGDEWAPPLGSADDSYQELVDGTVTSSDDDDIRTILRNMLVCLCRRAGTDGRTACTRPNHARSERWLAILMAYHFPYFAWPPLEGKPRPFNDPFASIAQHIDPVLQAARPDAATSGQRNKWLDALNNQLPDADLTSIVDPGLLPKLQELQIFRFSEVRQLIDVMQAPYQEILAVDRDRP